MLGKIEGRRRRGCQRLRWLDSIRDEHELGQTPGDGEGHGGLGCCCPWGHKESDVTGRLNDNRRSSLQLEIFPVLFFGGSDYIGGDQGSSYSL